MRASTARASASIDAAVAAAGAAAASRSAALAAGSAAAMQATANPQLTSVSVNRIAAASCDGPRPIRPATDPAAPWARRDPVLRAAYDGR